MSVGIYAVIAVAAYLLGSISASVLVSKLAFHKDVRTQGSGNAGATNVARVFGMGAGVLTLLADVGKTVGAMFLGRWLGGEIGLSIAGVACMIGHCWPVYFHFRGGKGVSVGAAIGAMIDWRVLLVILAVFFITYLICKTVSLCSIAAAIALPISAAVFVVGMPELILAIVTGVTVIVMHRSNIGRLLNGTEARFKPHTKHRKDHK